MNRTNDKIVLGLVSGTQQSLADGRYDERLMFGGKRSNTQPHPTHACPGYEAGIEAMLGTVTALLTRKERMQQGLAPLSFLAEGPCALPPHCLGPSPAGFDHAARVEYDAAFSLELFAKLLKPLPQKPSSTGLVLAVGDSWLRNPYPRGWDLREHLSDFGYQVPDDLCHYVAWGMADKLANKTTEICKFIRDESEKLPPGTYPKAILLSAGGNDSTGTVFYDMLDWNDHNPNSPALNKLALGKHIDGLKLKFEKIVNAIKADQKTDIPIFVHGYDHPLLPTTVVGYSWFRDQFTNRRYDSVTDRAKEIQALADLINAFNEMLLDLATRYKPWVRYVDLRGTLKDYWGNDAIHAWRDDLHPVNDGFFVLATKIDAAIKAPYP